ncbi:unnamed protein product [Schistosoma turkestanicum]|nr:unnamed protein product [Schistosoma turkestanicum]
MLGANVSYLHCRVMLGASDRTGEFRACTQLLHDRMLSGRLRLKPPHPKRNYSCDHAPTADLVAKSKQVSEELKMTVSKMSKLKLLLENASHSSPEVLSKLIEVIQYDIMDLNKTKLQLKANVSEAKERSTTGLQHLKHIDLIVIGLEYHLSFLVSEFRVVLEGHKTSLSTDSKKLDANIHVNTDPNPSTGYTVNSGIIESNKHSPSNHTSATSIPTIHLLKDQLLENKNQQCSSNLSNSTLSHVPPIHNSYSASSLPTIIPIAKSNGTLTVNRSEVYNSFQAETKSRTTEQLQIFASNPHVSLIDQEVRQRDAAIRRVESTIVQLGEIYQQFSTLVQEQNDLVLRIDSQTDNVEMNINEAHAQLLVFMRRISAQRGFLIKAFITIILCFVVFAWMMSACTTTLDSVDFCVEDATDENIRLPSKRHYRQRAHCNPWSDHTFDYPLKPELMDWDKLFGSDQASSLSVNNNSFDPIVRFLDVGCGYGGLLFSLSTSYPFTRSVGLEIRLKVCDFVQEKIKALRLKHSGQYNNVACIRTNAMKFLPNFFHKNGCSFCSEFGLDIAFKVLGQFSVFLKTSS